MENLKSVSKLVKAILEEYPQARNDDNFLYYMVLDHFGTLEGIDIHSMSVPYFLLQMRGRFPKFETVRRTRQHVQELRHDLRACKKVEAWRFENEKKFRDYSRTKTI